MSDGELVRLGPWRLTVNLLRRTLRVYSLTFCALFALLALAMALVIQLSKPATVNFYIFPWGGAGMVYGLVATAIAGLAIALLAWRGKMQMLFVGWSILVLALVVRYFFFSANYFTPNGSGIYFALGIVLAAALAIVGAGMKPRFARGAE